MSHLPKSSLSPARRQLIELCQEVNFGRVEGLQVRGGDPLFQPAPRVLREVKFGGENGARPERSQADFRLKLQHIELLAELTRIGSGTVAALEVKHGLPFRMVLEEAPTTPAA